MEYNVTVNKVDDENMQFDSSAECLNIALEEYRHVIDRANKYDNKVYIMITFCSIFFAFVLGMLDNLFELPFPDTTKNAILFIICIIIFITVSLCYIISMVLLVVGLRSIKLSRFKPKLLNDYSLWNKPCCQANMLAFRKYNKSIIHNNKVLEKAYKKINLVTILMCIVVCLSFIEYILLQLL